MTFEYFNTKFHRDRWKQKQPFTFWYCVDNFYPWKDIIGKKVSKLRFIAELRAFYGRPFLTARYSKYFLVQSKSDRKGGEGGGSEGMQEW
jgi:hypothetical protein